MHQKIIDTYEARVIRRGEDECWGWAGGKHVFGYGVMRIWIDGQNPNFAAHRVSYEIAHGQIPSGMLVRHKCHNPECSNPKHLELGTYHDNMQDSSVAGRLVQKIPRGEISVIKEMREAGWTLQEIGSLYSCTKQAVRYTLLRAR